MKMPVTTPQVFKVKVRKTYVKEETEYVQAAITPDLGERLLAELNKYDAHEDDLNALISVEVIESEPVRTSGNWGGEWGAESIPWFEDEDRGLQSLVESRIAEEVFASVGTDIPEKCPYCDDEFPEDAGMKWWYATITDDNCAVMFCDSCNVEIAAVTLEVEHGTGGLTDAQRHALQLLLDKEKA